MQQGFLLFFNTSFNQLKRQLGKVRKSHDPKAIHNFRVAFKRISALFMFVDVSFGSEDVQPLFEWLNEVKQVYRKAGKTRTYHLIAKQSVQLNLSLHVADAVEWFRIKEETESVKFQEYVQGVRLPTAKSVREVLGALNGRELITEKVFKLFYKGSIFAAIEILHQPPCDDWHDARRKLKACYLIANSGIKGSFINEELHSGTRCLEQLLGDWHDLEVLKKYYLNKILKSDELKVDFMRSIERDVNQLSKEVHNELSALKRAIKKEA